MLQFAFSEVSSGWSEKSGAKDGKTEEGVWTKGSEGYSEGGEWEGGSSEQDGVPPGKTPNAGQESLNNKSKKNVGLIKKITYI